MFVSRREIRVPELGVMHGRYEALAPHLRVKLVVSQNLSFDDRILLQTTNAALRTGWHAALIPFDGPCIARLEHTSAVLGRGGILVTPASTVSTRWTAGPSASGSGILVQWDPLRAGAGAPVSFAVGRIKPLAVERVQWLASVLADRSASGQTVATAMAALFAILHSEGIPVRSVEAEELQVDARTAQVGRAIDASLEQLGAIPGSVDLESTLGVSSKQTARLVSEFAARFQLHDSKWRDVRNAARLGTAALLMTAPRATTEGVASLIGCTPTALCRAFAQRGMPSPGTLRSVVAKMG